jgi:hypothetical protein
MAQPFYSNPLHTTGTLYTTMSQSQSVSEHATIPISFIAIASHLPALTAHLDAIGITANADVLDSCPAAWQRVHDAFTQAQLDGVIKNCDERKQETGGWDTGKKASRSCMYRWMVEEGEREGKCRN